MLLADDVSGERVEEGGDGHLRPIDRRVEDGVLGEEHRDDMS